MPTSYAALLIGGGIPVCLWSLTAILQKASVQHGLTPGPFLIAFGAMVVAGGLLFCGLQRGPAGLSWPALGLALAAGFAHSIATGLVSYALLRFGLPISKLAPILASNLLLTALIGVLWLGEGASVSAWRLLVGAATVFAGLVLVITA